MGACESGRYQIVKQAISLTACVSNTTLYVEKGSSWQQYHIPQWWTHHQGVLAQAMPREMAILLVGQSNGQLRKLSWLIRICNVAILTTIKASLVAAQLSKHAIAGQRFCNVVGYVWRNVVWHRVLRGGMLIFIMRIEVRTLEWRRYRITAMCQFDVWTLIMSCLIICFRPIWGFMWAQISQSLMHIRAF